LALGYPEPGQAGETAGLALGYPELGHPEPGQAGGTAGLALGYPEPVHPGAGYPNQPYPNAGPAYPPYPAAGYPNQPYPSAGPPAPAYPATGYADPAYPPATAVYPGPAGPFDPSGAATVAPYVDPAWAYVPTPSPYYVPQPPAPLPNTLGLVGLIMSVVTVAGGVLTAFRFGGGSGSNYDPWNPTYSNDAAVGIAFAFTGLSLIGLASFVIGIVAAASKRGRGQGVGAIVLSVLGPLVFFLALGIAIESNL
jgi:hypothetical protein